MNEQVSRTDKVNDRERLVSVMEHVVEMEREKLKLIA